MTTLDVPSNFFEVLFEVPFGIFGFFFTFCELLNKSTLRCATEGPYPYS